MTERSSSTDVSTTTDRDTVSASAVVDAPAAAVFDFVRRPANHPEISGDHSVRGARIGAEVLDAVGDRFGMSMKLYGIPYRMTSEVKEIEPDRRLSWAHMGGHRWTWDFEALDGGGARVTETFDLAPAVVPAALRLLGYPGRHEENVRRSVANVIAHFARP